jgi:ribosomal-protein-alanine N-acetyltransferase
MELTLLTDRLLLRPLRLDDLDLGIEMFTDPEVVRYVGGPEPQTAKEIEAGLPTEMKRCGGGCIGVWCVIDRETSEKLGTGILLPMPVDENDTNWDLVEGPDIPDCEIEVGYILKRSAWGKGYATEICRRLLAFAFEETPLEDIVACIDDDNEQSRRVLLKCGLRAEGRRRAYGEQSLCFRITREQWISENRC